MARRLSLRAVARALERSAQRTLRQTTHRTIKTGMRLIGDAVQRAWSPTPVPSVPKRAPVKRQRTALRTPRPSPVGAGDWLTGVTMGAGGARRWRLYRPPADAVSDATAPLLVMLHGCGQDAQGFAQATRMNRVARREGFWVLYPEQDRLANAHRCWNWFDTRHGRAQREAALILKAIDEVCRLYPVDVTRVTVAGLSAGAAMAALLATEHPERFRGIAMHAGVPPGRAQSAMQALRAMQGTLPANDDADPNNAASGGTDVPAWPPLLVIHGSLDDIVSPDNGVAAVSLWAQRLGAKARPARTVQRGQRHAMRITDYRGGRRCHCGGPGARGSLLRPRGPSITHVEIDGLGHAWSGGAAGHPYTDPDGPDASRLVWSFMRRHLD